MVPHDSNSDLPLTLLIVYFAKAGTSAGQLCLWNSEADIGDEISLKKTVMQEHSNLKIFSNLMDAHFYIFEKWVIDFIVKDE